jgi:hypothetical protein
LLDLENKVSEICGELRNKCDLVRVLNENIVNLSKARHKLKKKYKRAKESLDLFDIDQNSETIKNLEHKLMEVKDKFVFQSSESKKK